MYKENFCYKIHKDANLAHDTVTGAKANAYIKFSFDVDKPLSPSDFAHDDLIVINMLSKQLDIPTHYFKPITLAEYNTKNEGSK